MSYTKFLGIFVILRLLP